MKPSLQFPVLIDSTNGDIEVIISGAPTIVTIPDGTYFHTHDGDLTNSLPAVIMDALNDSAMAATFMVMINTDGKYVIKSDTLIKLSATGSSIYNMIGFHSDQLDPAGLGAFSYTAQEQHQYGWYADDNACLNFDIELLNRLQGVSEQSISGTGVVLTKYYGLNQLKEIELQWITKRKTFNPAGVYGTYNGGDTEINQALETWYNYAIKGNRFRFYRDIEQPILYKGTATAIGGGSPVIITDSNAAWTADEWTNHIVEIYNSSNAYEIGHRGILTGNTATQLEIIGGWSSFVPTGSPLVYVIKDFRYDTYVLDGKTNFEPELMFGGLSEDSFDTPYNQMVYKQKLIMRKFV